MTISMYQASIPTFISALTNLSAVLKKGLANATERNIDPSVFISARLAPDMLPLSRQIQIASDTLKGYAARVAGIEVPSWADDETTFEQLEARIQKTIAFLQTIKPEQIDGSEEKTIAVPSRSQPDRTFKGQFYLFNFTIPNLYFHITTAYAILRHNGVSIGKKDYLGA